MTTFLIVVAMSALSVAPADYWYFCAKYAVACIRYGFKKD